MPQIEQDFWKVAAAAALAGQATLVAASNHQSIQNAADTAARMADALLAELRSRAGAGDQPPAPLQ